MSETELWHDTRLELTGKRDFSGDPTRGRAREPSLCGKSWHTHITLSLHDDGAKQRAAWTRP